MVGDGGGVEDGDGLWPGVVDVDEYCGRDDDDENIAHVRDESTAT